MDGFNADKCHMQLASFIVYGETQKPLRVVLKAYHSLFRLMESVSYKSRRVGWTSASDSSRPGKHTRFVTPHPVPSSSESI